MRSLLPCTKKTAHLVYLRTTKLDLEVFYNQILTNFYTKIDETIRKQGEADIRACRDNDPVSNYFILNISNNFIYYRLNFWPVWRRKSPMKATKLKSDNLDLPSSKTLQLTKQM